MISIIIPTYNAAKCLPPLLESLEAQTIKEYELIVVDSSSEDNTVDIARSHNANVIIIQRSDFRHGATRTLATQEARGDIIIYVTQDVQLCDEHAIENIIKPFSEDGQITAVFGRQLPYPDASVFAQHLRLFNYPDTSYVRKLSDREQYGIKTVFFSNSFSAYRKPTLQEIEYFRNKVIFGEDTCAVADMLLKGHKIAYAADARVFHSHNYTICGDFRRYFDIGVFHRNERWLLREFGKAEDQGAKYAKSELAFLVKRKRIELLPQFVLRVLAKYIGYKMGRLYIYLPEGINRRFSLNPAWWNRPNKS